jgi:hypothetical protein
LLINSIEILKHRVQYPNNLGRVGTAIELDYIFVGLQNSKKEGYLK